MAFPIYHSQYTASQIEASIGKSPRVNSTTNTWEVWDIGTSTYIDTGVDASGGSGGIPSDIDPKMNGAASPGVSYEYSRGDHVHPTDTSRQAAMTFGDGLTYSGGELSLNETFYNYLVEETFETPEISAFLIGDLGGAAEIGTSVTVDELMHQETNIGNIAGNLTLTMVGNNTENLTLTMGSTTIRSDITASATAATVSFEAQTVTRASAGNVSFQLSGADTRGGTMAAAVSKTFYVPRFLGSSAATSVSAQDILNMSKGQNMPTSITLSNAAYIYFVTNGTITTVKDAFTGLGVPVETAVTTAVSINGVSVNYKVYRTSNMIVAGSYSFSFS